MAHPPIGGFSQSCCWQALAPAVGSLPMTTLKKPNGQRKPAPNPSDAEMAVYSYLIAANSTREERRLAVRHLLRQASKSLERGA
jgi:hypothetical protein